MSRRDYFNDPHAPSAIARTPGVSVVVLREGTHLLLVRRVDNGFWVVPGGALELGETAEEAGMREVLEETGVRCRVAQLRAIYTDPGHVISYSDGTVLQEFVIVLLGEYLGGELQPQLAEVSEVTWAAIDDLPRFNLHERMRKGILQAINGEPAAMLS